MSGCHSTHPGAPYMGLLEETRMVQLEIASVVAVTRVILANEFRLTV